MRTIIVDITRFPEQIPPSYNCELKYAESFFSVDSVGLSERISAEGKSEAEAIIEFLKKATEKFNEAIILRLED